MPALPAYRPQLARLVKGGMETRLARLRQDPWKEYWKSKQRLARAAIAGVRA